MPQQPPVCMSNGSDGDEGADDDAVAPEPREGSDSPDHEQSADTESAANGNEQADTDVDEQTDTGADGQADTDADGQAGRDEQTDADTDGRTDRDELADPESGRPGGRAVDGPLSPSDSDDGADADSGSSRSEDATPEDSEADSASGDAGSASEDADSASGDGDDSDGGQLGRVEDHEPAEPRGQPPSEPQTIDDSAETLDDAQRDSEASTDAEASYGAALDDPSDVGGEALDPGETEQAVSDEALEPADEEAAYQNPGPGHNDRAIADGAPAGGETPAEAGMAAGGTEVTGGTAGDAGQAEDGGLFGGGGGPESDQEMPLTEHIREMLRRLSIVVTIGSVVTLAVLLAGIGITIVPSAEDIVIFLWDHHVNFELYRPYVYGPLEFLLVKLKVAGLAGVIVALPMFVYQTYRFMRPGLYPNERRYYLAAVPTSLVLALVGVAFAHFVVLPAIFQYFIGYTEASAQLAFGVKETFNLILLLMGYMAVVFQIPLFIQLAIMMGLVTRRWMEQRRLIFWGTFFGISFLVSPDPTGMAPIIVTGTMIVLFEGTLALLRWTGN